MKAVSDKLIYKNLESYNLILLFIGFLLSSMFVVTNHLETTIYMKYSFRGMMFLVSILVIIKNILGKAEIPRVVYVYCLFFFIYFFRIFYDIKILKIKYFYSFEIYLLKYLSIVVIPVLSILFTDFTKVKIKLVNKISFIFLYVFVLVNLLGLYFKNDFNNVRSSGLSDLYPIMFGHFGASLALVSIYSLLKNVNFKDKTVYAFFYSIGVILGILVMISAASKGPLLAFLFVFCCILAESTLSFKKMTFVFCFFIIAVLGFLIIKWLDVDYFLNRIKDSILIKDASTTDRINLLKLSFDKFLRSPILGDSFLINDEKYFSFYPHNIVLESFMTTGVLGGIVFLCIYFISIKKSFSFFKTPYYVYSVLFYQYLVHSLLSSNLYSNSFFWIFNALMISLFYSLNKKQPYNVYFDYFF